MDLLFILYSLIFLVILVSPFFLNQFLTSKSQNKEESNERKILLDNLRDLKAELDTGKINFNEFENLSSSIIEKLESLKEDKNSCKSCGYEIKNPNAKFCENCGAKL